MRPSPLTMDMARQWADLGHMAFIDALTSTFPASADRLAFHGGTSLHLSWKSPRFSEDLDFLLDQDLGAEMIGAIPKIERRLRDLLRAHDPQMDVEIRNKTKGDGRLLNFLVVVSNPKYLGNAKIKAEFWQVGRDYLAGYETQFVFPGKPGEPAPKTLQPLPAATLQAAYADKLTAFATRPHLKWRDVFDLWWLGSHIRLDIPEMADRFEHHLTAFRTRDGLDPAAALRLFLTKGREEALQTADPDIKRWLPSGLWKTLEGDGITQIVDSVAASIEAIATHIETRPGEPQDEPEDHSLEP